MEPKSAYQIQKEMLEAFGLPSNSDVVNVINNALLEGQSEAEIELRLQDTETWKTRFRGNELLRQNGGPVLSIPAYLEQERLYGQILHNAGLPSGFYDDPADFAEMIGGRVSVQELQDRVNLAGEIVHREDPAVLHQLALRGITPGQLIAHALDPQRAKPLILRDQNSILIGAAAQRAGLTVDTSTSDRLAERGIGEAQAQQGFGQINDFLESTDKLGDIYGVDYSLDDAVDEVFEGTSSEKRKQLARTEKAAFGGQNSFGVVRRDTGGAF